MVFLVSESEINLYADRKRAQPVNDLDDRELTINCGCALMNLRVAAAAEGLDVRIDVLPDLDEPDLLARISFAATPEAPARRPHSCRSSNSGALGTSASCLVKWKPQRWIS